MACVNLILRLFSVVILGSLYSQFAWGADGYEKVERTYITAPSAPKTQSQYDVDRKNEGCVSCHISSDSKTMHVSDAVKLACVDCHGGN